MSDSSNPQKPKGPRMSHLQSEPISISFASPQQLAQLTAAAPGSLFPFRPQMKTPNQSYTSPMSSGSDANHQKQSGSSIASSSTTITTGGAVAAAAASSSTDSASSAQTVLKPPAAQPVDLDTFKGFKFVTLDALQIETRDVYDKISWNI